MSDDEDVWPRQLRQMGGLRLVGARPGGVRLVGVRLDDLLSPRWCLARYGLLHRKKTCRWSTASPRRCLGDVVDVCRVDVGVDVDDVATSTSCNVGLA